MSGRNDRGELFAGATSEIGRSRGEPDVLFEGSASAEKLRHLEMPRTRVRIVGSTGVEEESQTERRNLPEPIEPGKTYRGVRVHRWVAGRLGRESERPT
jgi:hypothetical protein